MKGVSTNREGRKIKGYAALNNKCGKRLKQIDNRPLPRTPSVLKNKTEGHLKS